MRPGSEQTSEFRLESPAPPPELAAREAPTTGLLATNHQNLMYMLSAGMVMPPAGFGGKYFADSLGCVSGWVPLFVGKPFATAVECSVSESASLKPCLLEIDLMGLSGPMAALRDGQVRRIRFPEEANGSDEAILVPAPLPLTRVRNIRFRTASDRKQVESETGEFNNVSLDGFRCTSRNKTLMNGIPRKRMPTERDIAPRETPLVAPQAAGGILAMLFHIADHGETSAQASRASFELDFASPLLSVDPILSELQPWLRNGKGVPGPSRRLNPRRGSELVRSLFWGAVDRLVSSKEKEADARINAGDVLLEYLGAKSSEMPERRLRDSLDDLLRQLESLAGFGNLSPTEIFQRHSKPFSRAITLAFLRETGEEFLEYVNRHLREIDWLAGAVLFGARSGWQELTLPLREPRRGLADAVSHRMAAMSHRIAGTEIDLGEAPPRCRPLRELFPEGAKWKANQRSAAVGLALDCDWDCVRTTIRLPKGRYSLRVQGRGVEVVLEGQPNLVTVDVDRDEFHRRLALGGIPLKAAAKARSLVA